MYNWEEEDESKNQLPYIAIAVPPRWYQQLSSIDPHLDYIYSINLEEINGRGRDKGIYNKGRDNGDGRSEAQLFIYASNALFADNSINRKSL